MPASLWIPLVAQVVVPAVLLWALARLRPRSRLAAVAGPLLLASWLALTAVAGLWLAVPALLLALWTVLLVGVTLSRIRGAGALPLRPRGAPATAALAALLGALSVTWALLAEALAGWRPSGAPPVELSLPFEPGSGVFLVANGGSREIVNAHLATLSGERYAAWRGQSHGVDLVKVDALGFRARGFLPRDPAAYAIFGEPVVAPCAGVVLAAVDGRPDMPPPRPDREHMEGNFVLLGCDGVEVLLGHLERGSLEVVQGRVVPLGAPLGRVGNSGNSEEPHLHLHAQRRGTVLTPSGGEPVPVRIDGRHPHRNARLRVDPEARPPRP